MSTVSTRQAQIDAHKLMERAISGQFRSLNDQVAGILARYAGPDGKILPAKTTQVRSLLGRLVESQFVARRSLDGAELTQERAHVNDLIERGQKDLRGASEAAKRRITGRLQMLVKRRTLLSTGVALVSITTDGDAVTLYARMLMNHMDAVTEAVVRRYADDMRQKLEGEPELLAWLRGAG